MIHPADDEILCRNLVTGKREGLRGTCRPKGLQIQKGSRVRNKRGGLHFQRCHPCIHVGLRRHRINNSRAQTLPDSLIISKEEGFVLPNWATDGASELVPPKGRFRDTI